VTAFGNAAGLQHGITGGTPCVSIVIPMLNERDGLSVLFSAIRTSIASVPIRWEIVAVDDGSTDGTRDLIARELSVFAVWKAVILARTFGQQAAYRAGLEAARGDAVIFLDADLQDPPELIPQLVDKWRQGFKVVIACRTSRAERGLRRWLFDLFHHMFHRITHRSMPLNSGMFSLIDRVVVDRLLQMKEVNLFLPALRSWFGYAQTTITYARRERAVGEPKQSLPALFGYALNGVIGFSDLPLQWIGLLGLGVSLASFAYGAVLLLIKFAQFFHYFESLQVLGFTTLAVAMFGIGGIQLMCLGIIGQYLARIYREIKGRPLYIVDRVMSSDEPERVREPR
jgi:dolichol-phosphate mannosyltransferase